MRGRVLTQDVDQAKQQEVLESISRGEFSMRDMYNQFQNILSLGPLNKVGAAAMLLADARVALTYRVGSRMWTCR